MPLDQFFRALPVVLLLGTIPGIALTILLSRHLSWPERLAAAPGFSVGLIGVIGLLLRAVGLPFSVPTAVPILAVLVGLAAAQLIRWRLLRGVTAGAGWTVTGLAIAAGAILAGVSVAPMQADAVPPATDAALHATVAADIVQARDVLPIVPIPADGSGFVRPLAAFEATDALASELGAGDPAGAMLPLALISVLVLPLGVAVLANEATGDRRVAATASLLSLGVIFPAWPVAFGDYPYLADSTLVVPLILAVARCLRGASIASNAMLAGAAVLSIWVTHGLEILSAFAVGGFLWLAVLGARRRDALPGAAAALAAGLIAAIAGYLLTRAPALPLAHPSGSVVDESSAYLAEARGVGLGAVQLGVNGVLTILSGGLLCLGAVVVVVRRRGRWLLGSLLLPVLLVADTVGPQWLYPIWVRAYPWSELVRLCGLEFFVMPVLAAVGGVGLGKFFSLHAPRTGSRLPGGASVWAAATLAVIAAAGVLVGAFRTFDDVSSEAADQVLASSQDVSVIYALAAHLPRGSLILNNGYSDSGQWIDALTSDVAVEPKGYAQSYPSDWRVVALAGACSDPSAAQAAVRGVAAVFVGSKDAPGALHPWSAECISSIPGLHLVAGSTAGAAGFMVSDP